MSLLLPVFLSLFQFLSLPLPVFLFLFQFLSLPLPVFSLCSSFFLSLYLSFSFCSSFFLSLYLSFSLPVWLSPPVRVLFVSLYLLVIFLPLPVSLLACLSFSLPVSFLSFCINLSTSACLLSPYIYIYIYLYIYIYIYIYGVLCCIGQHCVNPSLMCKTHCPICFRNLYIAFSQSKHLEQRSLSLPFTVHFCSTFSFSTSEYYNSFSVTLLFLTAYSWKCHFEIWVCHDWDIDPSLVLSLSLRNYYVEVVVLWF